MLSPFHLRMLPLLMAAAASGESAPSEHPLYERKEPEPIDIAGRDALRADRLRRKRENFAKRQPK